MPVVVHPLELGLDVGKIPLDRVEIDLGGVHTGIHRHEMYREVA